MKKLTLIFVVTIMLSACSHQTTEQSKVAIVKPEQTASLSHCKRLNSVSVEVNGWTYLGGILEARGDVVNKLQQKVLDMKGDTLLLSDVTAVPVVGTTSATGVAYACNVTGSPAA